MCGVGEVCTDPDYRGKGVSNVSLPDAIAVIEKSGAPLSTLHAAAGVQGLYAKYVSAHSVLSPRALYDVVSTFRRGSELCPPSHMGF